MNTVNVSRGAGWLRVFLSVACFAAVGWGVYLLAVNHGTQYWNFGAGSQIRLYAFIALYVVAFLAAVVGTISGFAAVRSPGHASGWILNVALVVLLALTLLTCAGSLKNQPFHTM